MKIIKKNIKLILGIILCNILVSSISVYATYTYFATDVIYTIKGSEMSVAEALNDLYKNKKETTKETKEITTNGKQILDKYYKNLNINITSDKKYTQAEYDILQNRVNNLEDQLATLSTNSFSSIKYLRSTDTLVSNGGTAANANIELDAGTYILVASGKNSDYSVIFSLSGDDSIETIGGSRYSGSGAENVNGYHNGRGSGQLMVYMVTLTKTTTLTFSISGMTVNSTKYNSVGSLGVYELYK